MHFTAYHSQTSKPEKSTLTLSSHVHAFPPITTASVTYSYSYSYMYVQHAYTHTMSCVYECVRVTCGGQLATVTKAAPKCRKEGRWRQKNRNSHYVELKLHVCGCSGNNNDAQSNSRYRYHDSSWWLLPSQIDLCIWHKLWPRLRDLCFYTSYKARDWLITISAHGRLLLKHNLRF